MGAAMSHLRDHNRYSVTMNLKNLLYKVDFRSHSLLACLSRFFNFF